MQLKDFGNHLLAARLNSGLTQLQLAQRSGLYQSIISSIENGKRLPTVPQLLQLATVMKVPLQWFLTGTYSAGNELRDISVQLQNLGIADLQVENERIPASFRPDEEIIALALTGNAPSARIIEAMPALLAWNAKNRFVLRWFADFYDPRIKYRLGWLADIAVTIHHGQGFPGGCPSLSSLEAYIREVELPNEADWLGFRQPNFPTDSPDQMAHSLAELSKRPPVSLRWKMGYPAPLSAFRERAERLHKLRSEQMFRVLSAS